MKNVLALIVQPLTGATGSSAFADEATIGAALSVLGVLQERGWTVLLHSDPTVAVALALSGLEQRPAVPLELQPDSSGGARIFYIALPVVPDEISSEMLSRPIVDEEKEKKEESPISLADILAASGLLQTEKMSFFTSLREHRPRAILALTSAFDSKWLDQAIDVAEAYAAGTDTQLFTVASDFHHDNWRPLAQMLTPAQREMSVSELPGDRDDTRRDDDVRFAVDRQAMEAARVCIAAERAVLRLIGELE
jgi:hypothetical protein